jgi:hypothetical protein
MARQGQAVTLRLTPGWVATACVIALLVFPAVWRSLGADADAPLIAQLGLAAQGGVFWGLLAAGAQKRVSV